MKKFLLILLTILLLSFVVSCGKNDSKVEEIKAKEIVTIDEYGKNVNLEINKNYLLKDIRDYQTMHNGYLGYHAYFILENDKNERFIHEYISYNGDRNIWEESSEKVYVKGIMYEFVPFVPGDILHYLGENKFELVK